MAWRLLSDLKLSVAPFQETDAHAAGELYPRTASLGLSLGDRACLALALRKKATVWTADRVWKRLQIGVTSELIRL